MSSDPATVGVPSATEPCTASDSLPATEPCSATENPPTPAPETTGLELAGCCGATAPAQGECGTAPATAASDPATADATPASPVPEARPRPRLNPTLGTEPVRAVPNLSPEAPESIALSSAAAAAASVAFEETAVRGPVAQRGPSAPVELPPADVDLGEDLEAQIAQAMEGAAKQVPQPTTADAVSVPQSGTASPAGRPEGDAAAPAEVVIEPGARLRGKVVSIHGDDVFVDVGLKSPALVPLRQFESARPPMPGQLLEIVLDQVNLDEGTLTGSLPRGNRRPAGNWESLSVGQVVDCLVTKTNKGGLEVTVGTMRAFLPASQIELGFVSELEPYVGQKLRVTVTEVNPKKRNLVVSRRQFLQAEREETGKTLWQTLAVGQTFTGRVKTIKDYGVFVDLGGADGFLHVGEISWQRIKSPADVLQVGQEVQVSVISLDAEKRKIGLGMKQLQANPWSAAQEKYASGATVRGTVTRLAEFGAFVELEPGLEGLIHISELDHRRVRKVGDVLKVGQQVEVKVLEADPEKKRIGLSLKALQAAPEAPAPKVEEPVAPIQRKFKGTLKGGTGSTGPGGLFGNPVDWK